MRHFFFFFLTSLVCDSSPVTLNLFSTRHECFTSDVGLTRPRLVSCILLTSLMDPPESLDLSYSLKNILYQLSISFFVFVFGDIDFARLYIIVDCCSTLAGLCLPCSFVEYPGRSLSSLFIR